MTSQQYCWFSSILEGTNSSKWKAGMGSRFPTCDRGPTRPRFARACDTSAVIPCALTPRSILAATVRVMSALLGSNCAVSGILQGGALCAKAYACASGRQPSPLRMSATIASAAHGLPAAAATVKGCGLQMSFISNVTQLLIILTLSANGT